MDMKHAYIICQNEEMRVMLNNVISRIFIEIEIHTFFTLDFYPVEYDKVKTAMFVIEFNNNIRQVLSIINLFNNPLYNTCLIIMTDNSSEQRLEALKRFTADNKHLHIYFESANSLKPVLEKIRKDLEVHERSMK